MINRKTLQLKKEKNTLGSLLTYFAYLTHNSNSTGFDKLFGLVLFHFLQI